MTRGVTSSGPTVSKITSGTLAEPHESTTKASPLGVGEPPPGPKRLERARLIRQGLRADVPQRRQQIDPKTRDREGTCGLYALGMVQDFWHAEDPRATTALVKDVDADGPGVHYRHEPTTRERIFDYVRDAGYSATGEIFTAAHLGEIAEHFGYRARVHDGGDLDALYRVLDAGHPALVCFDVDPSGNPHEVGGDHAHWGVITGYFDYEGARYVTAKHGWDVEAHHVWRAEDFARSWRNLKTTDYYGTPGDGVLPGKDEPEPHRVRLPDAGGGRADIEAALAGKIVEVVPAGREPALG